MKYGLTTETIDKICGVFKKYSQIDKVILYGSRAKGNYKKGSDIDLTLYGDELSHKLLMDVLDDLDELLLPYMIDLSVYDALENDKLKEHIDRVGVIFYTRSSDSELKPGWEVKKLGEVCELITCGVAAKPKYVDVGIPFLSAKNVKNGKVIFSDFKNISNETHLELTKNNKPQYGDILYTRVGSYGEAAVIEENIEFSIFVSLTLIKVKNKVLNNYYLKYFLNSEFIKLLAKKSISGSGVGNLNVGTVRNFEISIPSLAEQEKIVSILDKAFFAIEQAKQNAEKNLKNAKELFDSYLNNLFTNKGDDWEERTLAQISTDFGRGKSKHRPRNDTKLYGGLYPFIQTGDIRNCNHYVKNYSQTYNELGLAQSKLWKSGTICITIAANIAETGILTFDACFPDSVLGLVVNGKFAENLFVEYLLQFFKTKLQSLSKGSAQANINMQTFENEKFPFPSLSSQKIIVKELDALSAKTKQLEEIYQQKIIALEDFKKSILQKAFHGELI